MRVLLRDLTPGQDYLMQFRSNNGIDVSPWSPIYNFRTDGDATAPSNPGALTWVPTGESFVASWTAPTLDGPDVNGVQKALKDFKDYEVTVEANGKTKVYYTVNTAFDFTLVMNQQAFGGIELTVKITVKSRDFTGNKSSGVTLTATEDTPPTPSTPVVTNSMGQISLEWDGLTALGAINPFNLEYIEIHASTTNNFTPADSTKVARFEGWIAGKQRTILTGLTYGTLHYFKLVSVNRKGKKSPPSGQAQGTPKRVSGLDIDSNAQLSAAQMNFTARNLGGANAFYGATLPAGTAAPDGTVYKDGDVFYNNSLPPAVDSGKTYRRAGTGWVEDTNIGVISGKKILTNTLTADAVGTNLLITSKANIGNLVVDDANIANVNVGKIVADETKTNLIIANTANIKDAIITSAKIVSLSANKITTGSLSASEKIIAGDINGTHAEVSGTGFRVFAEDTIDGVPNEVIRLGTDTNDYFGVTDAEGQLVASVDQTGRGAFKDLVVNNPNPSFGGTSLEEMLWQLPRGVIGQAEVDGPIASSYWVTPRTDGEVGLAEFAFSAQEGRDYELLSEPFELRTSTGDSAFLRVRYTTTGSTATVTSPKMREYVVQPLRNGWSGSRQFGAVFSGPAPGTAPQGQIYRLLMTYGVANGSTGVSAGVTDGTFRFIIRDIGPTRPNVAIYSAGGGTVVGGEAPPPPPPTTAKVTRTDTHYMNWSRSWKETPPNSWRTDVGSAMYQGKNDSYNGNQGGSFAWHDITGSLAGATINKIELYLNCEHAYYNSGLTARIGRHGVKDMPSIFPGYAADWFELHFGKPEGKWFTLPASWYNDIKSGSTRGITIFAQDKANDLNYYGRFSGVGAQYPPTLRVTYTK